MAEFTAQTVMKTVAEVAKEYENILQEHLSRIKEIPKEDFNTYKSNCQKLLEETKQKLHNFIVQTFKDHPTRDDFAQKANTIFATINKKIIEDLSLESNIAQGSAKASKTLEEQFEEELLQLNIQINQDFEEMSINIAKLLDDTKAKVLETVKNSCAKNK